MIHDCEHFHYYLTETNNNLFINYYMFLWYNYLFLSLYDFSDLCMIYKDFLKQIIKKRIMIRNCVTFSLYNIFVLSIIWFLKLIIPEDDIYNNNSDDLACLLYLFMYDLIYCCAIYALSEFYGKSHLMFNRINIYIIFNTVSQYLLFNEINVYTVCAVFIYYILYSTIFSDKMFYIVAILMKDFSMNLLVIHRRNTIVIINRNSLHNARFLVTIPFIFNLLILKDDNHNSSIYILYTLNEIHIKLYLTFNGIRMCIIIIIATQCSILDRISIYIIDAVSQYYTALFLMILWIIGLLTYLIMIIGRNSFGQIRSERILMRIFQ